MFGKLRRWLRVESQAQVTTVNTVSGVAGDVVQAGRIDQLVVMAPDDIAALRDVTEANLRALSDHGGLPDVTSRSVVERPEMMELTGVGGNFVITGEPGCGKSGALFRLTEHLGEQGEDVVLLTVESLGETTGAVRVDMTLQRPLCTVLTEWTGDVRGTLLIDGVDASRRDSLTWLASVVTGLDGSRWRTVATMRRFDLRHGTAWRRAFAGSPISDIAEHRDSDLPDVRHFLLGDFSARELETLAAGRHDLCQLLQGATEHLLRLVRNPFNLRLACELLQAGESARTLATARDQLELLQRYWNTRVVDHPDGEARARVLTEVSREMLVRRRLRASTSVVPNALLDASHAVVRDGVLREVPGRLRASGSAGLVFSHHILFDFSVAALLLTEEGRSRLTKTLNDDPNLVLVARPSVDLHLADVWHADYTRHDFAHLVISLAEAGHHLAGIAAAGVLLAEADEDNDLRWLTDLPDGPGNTATIAAIIGWICGVMSAASDQQKARVRTAVGLWSALASRLVTRLEREFDNQLAGQTFRLLQQLHDIQPLRPASTAADERSNCLATLMALALGAPEERGWLATAVASCLPNAIEVRPAHAPVLRRTLDPTLMALWPPKYLNQYLRGIAAIARVDAQLAEEIVLAIWRFHDDSREPIPLLSGVVALTSTRKQDVEHLKWLIGRKFSEYIAEVGLRRAVPVLAEATTPNDRDLPPTVPSYPIVAGSATGQVDLMMGSLRYSGVHEAPLDILKSFVDAMRTTELSANDADVLVADLVSSIRHPEAWRRLLLGAADTPEGLGRAFLPALLSGGLFVHSETRAAAGTLVRSILPHLSDNELDELETAITRIPTLLDDTARGYAGPIVDQLLGCLDVSRIRNPELATRMTQLASEGGPPDLVDFDDEIGELISQPTTLPDYLGKAYNQLTDEEGKVLESLRHAIDAAEGDPDPKVADVLESALRLATTKTESLFQRDPEHMARELIIRAAEVLITKANPAPGSPCGELIVSLLLNAMTRGAIDEEAGEQQ